MATQTKRCAYPELSAALALAAGQRAEVEFVPDPRRVEYAVTVLLLDAEGSQLGEATFFVCGMCEAIVSQFFPQEYQKSVKLRPSAPQPTTDDLPDPCAGGCSDPEMHAEGGHDI